jgi:hypothetical protein
MGVPSATQSAEPLATSTVSASASPASGSSDLAGLLATIAPALAAFGATEPVIATAEEHIAQLQAGLDETSEMFPGHPSLELQQAEIDRYAANGLVERGSFAITGTTPSAGILVFRYESEAGAAADFETRQASCDNLTVPSTEIADVVAKGCNVPDSHNDVHLIAHRGDLVFQLSTRDLPEDEALEPAVATLTQLFLAIDPLLRT